MCSKICFISSTSAVAILLKCLITITLLTSLLIPFGNSEPIKLGTLLEEVSKLNPVVPENSKIPLIFTALELILLEGSSKGNIVQLPPQQSAPEVASNLLKILIDAINTKNLDEHAPEVVYNLSVLVDKFTMKMIKGIIPELYGRQLAKVLSEASPAQVKLLLQRYVNQLSVEERVQFVAQLTLDFPGSFCSFVLVPLGREIVQNCRLETISAYIKNVKVLTQQMPNPTEMFQNRAKILEDAEAILKSSVGKLFSIRTLRVLKRRTLELISGTCGIIKGGFNHFMCLTKNLEDFTTFNIAKTIRKIPTFKGKPKELLVLSALNDVMFPNGDLQDDSSDSANMQKDMAKSENFKIATTLMSTPFPEKEAEEKAEEQRCLALQLLFQLGSTVLKKIMVEVYTREFVKLFQGADDDGMRILLREFLAQVKPNDGLEIITELIIGIPEIISNITQEATKLILQKFNLEKIALLVDFLAEVVDNTGVVGECSGFFTGLQETYQDYLGNDYSLQEIVTEKAQGLLAAALNKGSSFVSRKRTQSTSDPPDLTLSSSPQNSKRVKVNTYNLSE